MQFRWRGRESETGSSTEGSGRVTIGENRKVQGIFHGMRGHIDFKGRGKRNFIPSGRSGYDTGYYRLGWEDYAHDGEFDFYSNTRNKG
jgi:hypothetical protein